VRSLDDVNHALPSLRAVMERGHKMYERSKGKASPPSYQRAKEMTKDPKWMLASSETGTHPVLLRGVASSDDARRKQEAARQALLLTVKLFKPHETVFEVTGKGNTENSALMKQRRKALDRSAQRALLAKPIVPSDDEDEKMDPNREDVEMADEEDIVVRTGSIRVTKP